MCWMRKRLCFVRRLMGEPQRPTAEEVEIAYLQEKQGLWYRIVPGYLYATYIYLCVFILLRVNNSVELLFTRRMVFLACRYGRSRSGWRKNLSQISKGRVDIITYPPSYPAHAMCSGRQKRQMICVRFCRRQGTDRKRDLGSSCSGVRRNHGYAQVCTSFTSAMASHDWFSCLSSRIIISVGLLINSFIVIVP